MNKSLKAPFPWFGGKSTVADIVWSRLGQVRNYVEPFYGSGAVLLARPTPFEGPETVNDLDGLVSNFWRALAHDPQAVAAAADWPANENDLHARHAWLVGVKDSLQARLEGDPEYYDAKIAGWWCWGLACWIGSGFCSGQGPWQVREIDGVSQLVHVGNQGQGVNRKRVHVGDQGRGVNRQREAIGQYFEILTDRLRDVRVCCGDWSRVCGPSVTSTHGMTGVFLDPPYSAEADRDETLYLKDCPKVAHEVSAWCRANGDNPLLRIALCGYEGEHDLPGWDCVAWKARVQSGDRTAKNESISWVVNGLRSRMGVPCC